MTINSADLLSILPVIIVVVWAVLVLAIDLFIPRDRKGITAFLTAFGLMAALGAELALMYSPLTGFGGMVVLDGFSVFAGVLILSCGIFAAAIGHDYLKRLNVEHSEFYSLVMFSTAGMLLLVQSFDLIVFFLGLELLSIPIYVLAGMARPHPKSEEAGIKYFILGTMSSGILFYGIALIYAGTGHTGLEGIIASAAAPLHPTLFLIGAAMFIIGLAFKMAAVPFHMWAPDVYEGAPTPVTGWMAVSVKVAAVAGLLRVLITIFPSLSAQMAPVLLVLAGLSMLAGNLLALVQSNIKRLLAYSSIAHVGYMLLALGGYANDQTASDAIAAVLFYLVGYGLTSFVAWAVVSAAETSEGKGLEIADYAGFGLRHPWLGAAMTVAMVSFTGIPPTLGFWGKFYVFRSAVENGNIGLAVFGLLISLASAYYYLRVVVTMYMRPGTPAASRDVWTNLVAVGSAIAVVALALFPFPILEQAARALMKLL